jgi:response regulator RpfG family c-di-GMP phosphodiesterase
MTHSQSIEGNAAQANLMIDVREDKARILIVDDENFNVRILATALKDDYDIVAADSGASALALAAAEPAPDLILLDVLMPDMDGFEACARLKANPATASIPVIFVTMIDDHVNEERGFHVGAVDYVYKPIKPTVVQARVRVHMRLKQHRDFLEQMVKGRSDELEQARGEAAALLKQLEQDDTSL